MHRLLLRIGLLLTASAMAVLVLCPCANAQAEEEDEMGVLRMFFKEDELVVTPSRTAKSRE